MQLSYDCAKDRALMCLRANYESHLRAPQHTANTVKQTERELEGLELKYLPPGCPNLNSMEEK